PPPTTYHPLSLHDALPILVALTPIAAPAPTRSDEEAASPCWCLSGARRQCKSPSEFQRHFSRKGLIERRSTGRVKPIAPQRASRSEEHTSELQSRSDLVCR